MEDLVRLLTALAGNLNSLQGQVVDAQTAAQNLADLKFKEGVESVKSTTPAPTEGTTPAETTPAEGVDVEALKAELAAAKEEKDKALSDDATDKEKINSLEVKVVKYEDMIAKFDAILHPAV